METVMFVLVIAVVAIATPVYGEGMGNNPCKGQCTMPNGTCIAVNETSTVNCTTFKCIKRGRMFNYKPVVFGCVTTYGCKSEGEKWDEPLNCMYRLCFKKKVAKKEYEVRIKDIPYGCRWNGRCKLPTDGIWDIEEECTKYRCSRQWNGNHIQMKLISQQYGCSFRGECKKKHETWKDGCQMRKCIIYKKIRKSKIIKFGCKDSNDTCHDLGEQWQEHCSTLKCVMRRTKSREIVMKTIVTSFGCRYGDKCLKNKEKATEDCVEKRCKVYKRKKAVEMEIVRYRCMDANNECHRFKEKGWPYVLNGTRYENCYCEGKKNEDGSYVIEHFCN